MPFLHHRPAAPLASFAPLFWYYSDYVLPHKKERLLPSGSIELVINLHQDENRTYDRENLERYDVLPGAIVCGPHAQHFVIDTAGQQEVIGIHFRPGGAFPFLGLPVSELHNRQISLEMLWGRAARRLREQILEARAPFEKMRVLERALLAQWRRSLAVHPAVQYAVAEFARPPRTRSIAEVTNAVGLSPRRFIELFARQTGYTPKVFYRIQRFQQAITRSRVGLRVEWADVALACGYYDQAHFVHDFREFSGLNPSAYLSLRNEHQNHVPLG